MNDAPNYGSLMTMKQKKRLAWVLDIALVSFFTINSLGTCIVAALMGKEWDALSSTTRFMIVIVIMVNWSTMMMAYINRRLTDLLGTGEGNLHQQPQPTMQLQPQ